MIIMSKDTETKTVESKTAKNMNDSSIESLAGLIEAAVFVSEEPMDISQMKKLSSARKNEITKALELLKEKYGTPNSGLRFTETAGGYRLETNPLFAPTLKEFYKGKDSATKLSRAAMESLAIIAYKQPVTVPEINDIRSVDSSGVIQKLLKRKMIKILGRKEVVGKPLLYGTTREFLARFGLNSIDDLPAFDEFFEVIDNGSDKRKLQTEFDEHIAGNGTPQEEQQKAEKE